MAAQFQWQTWAKALIVIGLCVVAFTAMSDDAVATGRTNIGYAELVKLIHNRDVWWQGTFGGSRPAYDTSVTRQIISNGKKCNEDLVEALSDTNRWVVAHLLLLKINATPSKVLMDRWTREGKIEVEASVPSVGLEKLANNYWRGIAYSEEDRVLLLKFWKNRLQEKKDGSDRVR